MSDDQLSPQRLRALAHPLRTRIFQHLIGHCPARVSDIAVAVGVEPNSASFHLRQLEKYGYARRVRPEGATGAESWWEPVEADAHISLDQVPRGESGAEVRAAVRAGVEGMALVAAQGFMDRAEHVLGSGAMPPEGTLRSGTLLLWLRPEQGVELGRELSALFERWAPHQERAEGASLWSLSSTYFETREPPSGD